MKYSKVISCDVVVIGGGTAGAISAIASGRLGLETILIEKTQRIGGVPVLSLMGSFANLFFNSKREQMTGGIVLELLQMIISKGGTIYKDLKDFFSMEKGYPITVPYKPEYYESALLTMLEDSSVNVLLDSFFVDCTTDDSLKEIIIKKDNQNILIKSKVFIDATGDATVATIAGAPVTTRESSHGCLMRIGGVDIEETLQYIFAKEPWKKDDDFMDWIKNELGLTEEGFKTNKIGKILFDPVVYDHAPMDNREDYILTDSRLQYIKDRWEKEGVIYTLEMSLFRYLLKTAVDNKDFFLNKDLGNGKGITFNGDGIGFGAWGEGIALANIAKPYGFDATDVFEHSIATLEARKYNLMTFNFFKGYVPGFQNSFLLDMGSQAISRSWRHIAGFADGKNATEDPDSVLSQAIYVFGGIYEYQYGEPIPYGVIVPKKTKNLFVVGKCASGAHKCRSQVSCMSMGVAAAAAAKTLIDNNSTNTEIEYTCLKENLEKLGVLLEKRKLTPNMY